MREPITVAQLIKKYGPARIDRDPPKLYVASLIHMASAASVSKLYASKSPYTQRSGSSFPGHIMPFKFLLCNAGPNQNDQVFIEDELRNPEIFQSPIGEPIDRDHIQTFEAICGDITDSLLCESNDIHPMGIKCSAVIFEGVYPDVALKARQGAGRWAAVSMEALPNPLERVGKYLIIHNPQFVGAGLVRFPGNVHSKIEEIDGESTGANQPKPAQESFHRRDEVGVLTAGINLALLNL